MIDTNTLGVVHTTLAYAQGIFENKAKDYGTAWRWLRIISVADQLFIKAQRIRTVQENKLQRVNGINDDIGGEFIGIINYGMMGIIQNRIGDMTLERSQLNVEPTNSFLLSMEEAMYHYFKTKVQFIMYVKDQNPYYIEQMQAFQLESIADMLLIKIIRIKNLYKNFKESKVKIVSEKANIKSIEDLDRGYHTIIYGALLEIILWATIGHANYKAIR